MAYENLPGIITNFPDGGLTIQRNRDLGDSILIIGTAEDGPKNEPVVIQSLDHARNIFGRFGQGDLVRGVYETWNATDSPVDVRAMRVGNGAVASVGIPEASGYLTYQFSDTSNNPAGQTASGVADLTWSASGRLDTSVDALRLTAKYEGSKYNSFSLRIGQGNSGRHAVVVYNPFTGNSTEYTYDYYNTMNNAVDVHNSEELVAAINSTSDLAPYISAATTELTALYEVLASGIGGATAAIVPNPAINPDVGSIPQALGEGSAIQSQWNSNATPKKITLNLHHITTSTDVSSLDGIPDAVRAPEATYGIPAVIKVGPIGGTWSENIHTAGNQLIDLKMVYEIPTASGELLATAGKDWADLAHYPINRNESQSAGAVPGNTVIQYNGFNNTVSEYKQHVQNALVGVSTDGTTAAFDFNADLEPDATNWFGATITLPHADYSARIALRNVAEQSAAEFAYPGGALQHIVPGTWTMADGRVINISLSSDTKVYETIDGVTAETRKPHTLGWIGGTATVTFTDSTQLPLAGTIITIDYESVTGTLTEYNTRTALENTRTATNSHRNYFVTGNRIYFAGSHDTDIKLSYEWKKDYDIPGDVSITDSYTGKIEFTNPENQPQIHSSNGTRIGLNYTYRPEWINPTGTVSLGGGSNGTNMTRRQLKDALTAAYENLEDYLVDIIVPMGARLDSTMEGYSPETGILREMNCGFHIQLANLLDAISNNVGETIGIIGVEPAKSNGLADVRSWVQRLTQPDSNDRLRGANFMPTFNSKWVQVVAAEPVINAGRIGAAGMVDYVTTGETIYAGLIPSLAAQVSTTNEYIGRSLLGLNFRLSRKQLNDLVGSRYVCFYNKPGGGPTVVKDVTAAGVGTDYDKLTTLRIVKLVMDIVREVADPYIGDINTVHKRNAMKTSINAALFNLTQAPNNALRDYSFDVTANAEEQRLGIVNVDITLVPVFCMERINVTVRLRNAI